MKKRVLIIAAVASAFVFTSNEVNAQSEYKPAAGDKTIEVQLIPFNDEAPIQISGFRLRSFSTESMAYRLTVNIGYSSETEDPDFQGPDADNDGIQDFETVDKSSTFGIMIKPGFENHWAGTERLSPYWGAELGLGYFRESMTNESYGDVNLGSDADNDLDPTNDPSESQVYEDEQSESSLVIQANFLLGVDYYFTQKMYLGTEVGFGLQYTNLGDIEYEYGQDVAAPDNRITATERGSDLEIGTFAVGGIRLGYAF
jgi:hypothetical protein